jgi:hypothetical protein
MVFDIINMDGQGRQDNKFIFIPILHQEKYCYDISVIGFNLSKTIYLAHPSHPC